MLRLLLISSILCAVVKTSEINTYGFQNPKISRSNGGNAICVSGSLPTTITANFVNILLPEPTTQLELTDALNVAFAADSGTVLPTLLNGTRTETKTYSIWAKLCFPADRPVSTIKSVHILVHGVTCDNNYWDLKPNYSYADAAAAGGYATLTYDRLGTGGSDHPHALQEVQIPAHTEIAHSIVQRLRNGEIGGYRFQNVVAVGHSLGSFIIVSWTAAYPDDLDAISLTGMPFNQNWISGTILSFGSVIANQDSLMKFRKLGGGYFTQSSKQGIHYPFFKYPYFDPKLLDISYRLRQTMALGELLVPASLNPAVNFRGHLQFVCGVYDQPACGGNCYAIGYPPASGVELIYPNANKTSQSHVLVDEAGHNINAHLNAQKSFNATISWAKGLGF